MKHENLLTTLNSKLRPDETSLVEVKFITLCGVVILLLSHHVRHFMSVHLKVTRFWRIKILGDTGWNYQHVTM